MESRDLPEEIIDNILIKLPESCHLPEEIIDNIPIKLPENCHLAEEIIENILIKLPVRSIIRFQNVCKSWFDLINIRRLISQTEASSLSLCFCFINYSEWLKSCFLDVFSYDDATAIGNGKKLAAKYKPMISFKLPSFYDPSSSFKLVGNCNGILCLTNHAFIMLVNPLLKEVKTLPDPRLCILPRVVLVGFGFDDKTLDFKVVRIFSQPHRAQVYSLRSNAWRGLDNVPLLPNNNYLNSCSTFLNGVVYWCVEVSVNRGIITFIMFSFNMATELFKVIEFPQDWRPGNVGGYRPGLFVFNQEYLAFISYRYSGYERSVNVWTFNKHGTEETWTKIYSIKHLSYLLKPLSFWKKSKLLYETTSGDIILYDLLNQRSSVVFDSSQLWQCNKNFRLERYYLELSMKMQVGVCGSSLVSINT